MLSKYILSELEKAKCTDCAMVGTELKLSLEERQEIAKLGFGLACSRGYGKYVVTWSQRNRAAELREKVMRKFHKEGERR